MTDPRETPFNGRVAHVSLRGKVEAARFVEGTRKRVAAVSTPVMAEPGGARERELLLGAPFRLLDEDDLYGFGFAEADGYTGWVSRADLDSGDPPTHMVAVARTYGKASPELKRTEPPVYLSFGAAVRVIDIAGGWGRVRVPEAVAPHDLHMPAQHLRPITCRFTDPVAVARLFMGTPYLWGGNSAFGLDCSGLVQAAMLACGIACPGDSDQQRARLGTALAEDAEPRRGDLYFWAGHVGILSDPETLLHANAHHMAVAEEPLTEAIERIAAAEDKPVLARRRVAIPPPG